MKILLVDDDALWGNIFIRNLKLSFSPCEIIWLKSADEVFQFESQENDCNFIILDVMMYWGKKLTRSETDNGFKTGQSLLKHLESILPKTPIGILTALQNPFFNELREFCELHYPMVKFIWEKPYSVDKIALEIRDYYKNKN